MEILSLTYFHKQSCWTDEEKVAGLIVSLTGGASEVLQTISEVERSYDSVICALERKYGCRHLRQVHRLEMHCVRIISKPNQKLDTDSLVSNVVEGSEYLSLSQYGSTRLD
uniref:Uncharacterized protein n=1 Tax=Megaselia scalaris TaxID=36166 RepID=T1GDB4_MEGSC